MPQGGMVIDNPGIREIALWDGDGGIEHAFPEIESLARNAVFQIAATCTNLAVGSGRR
jgi:ribosome biogenesis GTPase